jgi:hypothetical protein
MATVMKIELILKAAAALIAAAMAIIKFIGYVDKLKPAKA